MIHIDPAFDEWVAEARAIPVAAELARRGFKVLHENNGPCPACGGTDRFAVNLRKNVFICRASNTGGDAISLCEHIDGTSFHASVETLTGRPPPGRDSAESPDERDARIARLGDRDRAMAAQQRRVIAKEAEVEERDKISARRKFEAAAPIRGTHAAAYLAARGIVLPEGFGDDLRYCAALAYRGYADASDRERRVLGTFPAMVAAIRDAQGLIIGLHRTWLDPERPRKLTPPGDPRRNPVKKILGSSRGMIRLSPLTHELVMGEGIESTLSGHHLGIGGPDACYAAGVSLGNIAGAALDSLPHPHDPRRRVPGEFPDHNRPGVVLPDIVESVCLLVDGDADPVVTKAMILVAGRRFEQTGHRVETHEAHAGMDHNDMLMARAGSVATADGNGSVM